MMGDMNMTGLAADERRMGRDRRNPLALQGLRYGLAGGRRRATRRESEQGHVLVDYHDTALLVAALGILLLAGLDAGLTLNLLQLGAIEANPFMAFLLTVDVQLFVNIKLALTAGCLVLLVARGRLKLFGRIALSNVIWGLLVFHIALVLYEISLFVWYG